MKRAESLVAIATVAVMLLAGFVVGRNYERTNALAAEPTAPIVTITKWQAAARIDPICRVRQSAVGSRQSAGKGKGRG